MPSLDTLPGIDYWGLRRIDRTISPDAVGGALVGILLANPLGRLAAITATAGRQVAGPVGAHVAWYAGWALAAYAALLVIAHWNDIDEDASGSSEST